jgi:acyl-coenzyme A thioesterase PaaI-like protein
MTTIAASPRTKQPNSRHCFVCGVENRHGFRLEFYETGPDEVEAEVVIPEKFEGYPGVAHGGIVAALVDEISLRAAMAGRPTRFMVTGRMVIRYRKPVPVGVPLRLMGNVRRRRTATVEAVGRVLIGSEIAVEGEATLFENQDVQLRPAALEALGWKVYPDGGRHAPGRTPGRRERSRSDAERSRSTDASGFKP